MSIFYSTRKIFLDKLNSTNRQFLGYIISTRCYQSFNSVSQSIHTSSSSQAFRFGKHEFRVINRDKSKAILVNHYHLNLAFFISNHIVNSDFCRSSCRCIDSHNWQAFFSRLMKPFIILWSSTICSHDRNTTSCILWRTPAKTDDKVTAMFLQSSYPICDIFTSRVWLYIAKDDIFDSFCIQWF
ncbi:Uncharacterised protein [Streptococcus pneumoniae]|nr:Uncharacterised protein [Streptococcus pneumoniae]